MGRKIPGKKQKKPIDPHKQHSKRLAAIKDKINNPPGKEDIQEIPRSALHIMELKEKAKLMKRKVRKKDPEKRVVFSMKRALGKEVKLFGMDRPDRYIPELKQRKKEAVHNFTRRVKNVCDGVIREVTFEEKYGVEVKRNSTGNITEVKPTKAAKRSKKPKLSKKRKERERNKAGDKEPEKEFAKLDKIEFGDIVHQPPTNLKFPGKKQKLNKEEDLSIKLKPGNRDLLLKGKLKKGNINESSIVIKKKATPLEKQKQEERRKLVVEAFRKYKNAKT